MDNDRILENELLQIQQIRELDMEELQVEEVDQHSDDDDYSDHGGESECVAFNTTLATLHTYLGEVEDTHGRLAFLDGGAILNLPMFYLEGVVLFPEATLPLRVVQRRFKASVETAMNRVDAAYTIGVVRIYTRPDNHRLGFAAVGTTAEIRQYRRLEDGSLNIVTRGQQRFRMRRGWTDVEGVPWAEVQIIQEDVPLRTPKDAFAQLASVTNSRSHRCSHPILSSSCAKKHEDDENDLECTSDMSIESGHSLVYMRQHQSSIDSYNASGGIDESTSSDDEFVCEWGHRLRRSHPDNSGGSWQSHMHDELNGSDGIGLVTDDSPLGRPSVKHDGCKKAWAADQSKWSLRAPRTFWPHWVYGMYDSYCLAQRIVDMWRQIIGVPSMDGFMHKPDLLSFYIASKIPVSESTRQELLEIDGVCYRLRKEIQLLERFNLIRCKTCLTVIAMRSDMLVMSSDGPLNAFANPYGYVHEVMTFYKTNGLALIGSPVKEHTWFPGYAWTVTHCATCETNMGWCFTATKKNLQPRSFWGIRSGQIAEDMC